MNTLLSPAPAAQVPPPERSEPGVYRAPRHFDGTRSLAAMLLAAAVAALVVFADQMISTWADGHLLLGWVVLWVVVFAGSALLAGTARRLARATLMSLDGWSRSLAQARAEARLWDMASADPRLKAELLLAQARQADQDEERDTAAKRVPNDFSHALAPLGLDSGMEQPAGSLHRAGYLPYL
jgi:hypothetical protein